MFEFSPDVHTLHNQNTFPISWNGLVCYASVWKSNIRFVLSVGFDIGMGSMEGKMQWILGTTKVGEEHRLVDFKLPLNLKPRWCSVCCCWESMRFLSCSSVCFVSWIESLRWMSLHDFELYSWYVTYWNYFCHRQNNLLLDWFGRVLPVHWYHLLWL